MKVVNKTRLGEIALVFPFRLAPFEDAFSTLQFPCAPQHVSTIFKYLGTGPQTRLPRVLLPPKVGRPTLRLPHNHLPAFTPFELL